MKLLILGGTTEGRAFATQVDARYPQLTCITSFAGTTHTAVDVPGEVRIGGFGGIQGLRAYIVDQGIDLVVDATHPFATQITAQAAQACVEANIAYLRLERPQWTVPDNTDVIFVPDTAEAARLVARTSSSAFLTIGRKDLAEFQNLGKVKLLVRSIEAPDENLQLDNATYVMARPPFTLDDELKLMQNHRIDTLVTKASGGDATRAKLDAAAQIGARIVLVRRPPPPTTGDRVFNIADAVAWLGTKTT
ncbi:MAG: cobalt-precorrin-6A reductase [Magnetovibrio sp.]|nr:cobalt-precorrin-6A reductase [Magnetovibrio sp.]